MCAMNNPDDYNNPDQNSPDSSNRDEVPSKQQTPLHSDNTDATAQQGSLEPSQAAAKPPRYPHSYIVVDRLEDNALAVIETDEGAIFTLPQSLLPGGTVDGDVLRVERSDDGQRLVLARDDVARANTQARLQALRDKMRARSRLNQEDDIEL